MRKPIHAKQKPPAAPALSAEDSRLFRETIGEVIPVISDRAQLEVKRPKPRRRTNQSVWSDNTPAGLPLLATGDIMAFIAPGMQKRVLQRLRSGKFGIDAELDLHGLTVDEAKRQIAGFLTFCLAEGHRCLHLIHGKGYRSEGDYPILKNRINVWLRQHADVLAFCTARPMEGGTGAVYVLLREGAKHQPFGSSTKA